MSTPWGLRPNRHSYSTLSSGPMVDCLALACQQIRSSKKARWLDYAVLRRLYEAFLLCRFDFELPSSEMAFIDAMSTTTKIQLSSRNN